MSTSSGSRARASAGLVAWLGRASALCVSGLSASGLSVLGLSASAPLVSSIGALALGACGSEQAPLNGAPHADDDDADDERPNTDDGATTDGSDDGASADGDDGVMDAAVVPPKPSATCPAPEFPQDDESLPFELLDAQVVDQDGVGVPGMVAQVCGLNLCLFGETDDLGVVHRKESAQLKRVAFKYGDGLRYAQFARLLTDGPTYDLGKQATVAFPALSESPLLQAGEVLSSGGIELDLTGSEAKIDLLSFPDAEEHVFVASEFSPERWPDAVPSELGLEQVVALGPLKTKFCPPAKLTLPNTPEWPADSALELLLHIIDTANHWGAYGTFAVVGSAHVSADGRAITTDSDGGLPELGVIGLRLAE